MMDDVVNEVREEKMIQIVTENIPNYKEIAYFIDTKEKEVMLDTLCSSFN